MMVGCGLLSTLSSSQSVQSKEYGYQFVLGFGVGLTFSTISLMTSVESNPGEHAAAQGIVARARVLGGSIGVSAANALFNHFCHAKLPGVLTPAEISDLQHSTAGISQLTAAQAQAVRDVYAESFNHSMRICLYMSAVCLFLTAFTWQKNPPSLAQLTADKEKKALATKPTASTETRIVGEDEITSDGSS
ncbi:hypothetical protein ANO11243_042380 [Dothideomycetidae sp. 11243]|nr:hypothetical protein ANO11243_042380 [fungal sp. No.11243]